MNRMGMEPILPIKVSVTIGRMLNFDVTCKHRLLRSVGASNGSSLCVENDVL